MDTSKIGKKPNQLELQKQSITEPKKFGSIKVLSGTLIQLNLTDFSGVSDELKILNHSYGVIQSQTEIENVYKVKFFNNKNIYPCNVFELKILKEVSLSLYFDPQEFIGLMQKYGSLVDLKFALRNNVWGEKAKA